MPEAIALRLEGDAGLPTLIYLPGLHGDSTLTAGLSRGLRNRVRFACFTYPRTLVWTLADYAAAIEDQLAANGIRKGWLLGESFSSQVVWALVQRQRFAAQAVILAGGFVKHPTRWAVRPVGWFCRWSLVRWFFPCFEVYVKWVRQGYRHDPDMRATVQAFISRRTPLDLQAAKHRLELIATNDPRPIARATQVPVYAMTGGLDPIVFWPPVRQWLRRHSPALQDYQIIWASDHNVLHSAAGPSARLILNWMKA